MRCLRHGFSAAHARLKSCMGITHPIYCACFIGALDAANIMKTQRPITSHILGAMAICAAPLIAFALVSFLVSHIGIPFPRGPLGQRIVLDFIMAIFIVVPLTAIWLVVRWRMRRGVVPLSTLWLEVSVGLAAAIAIYCLVRWVWFYPSLTW